MKRSSCFKSWNAFSISSSLCGKLQKFEARRRYRKRKEGWNVFLSQSVVYPLSLNLFPLRVFHSHCKFLSGSLTFCLSLPPSSPLPLVNTHYGQQTQWQFSPSAIWDQYWDSSTTSWPDILISVIQTKCYAFCPPTRQPTVYSPSEWLKSNVERKHTFMDDYL